MHVAVAYTNEVRTINTSNSSIARNGASVILWRAKAKHNVEKERSPPDTNQYKGSVGQHNSKRCHI